MALEADRIRGGKQRDFQLFKDALIDHFGNPPRNRDIARIFQHDIGEFGKADFCRRISTDKEKATRLTVKLIVDFGVVGFENRRDCLAASYMAIARCAAYDPQVMEREIHSVVGLIENGHSETPGAARKRVSQIAGWLSASFPDGIGKPGKRQNL
jgi:hypothetical protein